MSGSLFDSCLLGNIMPSVPRLGFNPYDVWGEALHGVMGRTFISGRRNTSFPNNVAAKPSLPCFDELFAPL